MAYAQVRQGWDDDVSDDDDCTGCFNVTMSEPQAKEVDRDRWLPTNKKSFRILYLLALAGLVTLFILALVFFNNSDGDASLNHRKWGILRWMISNTQWWVEAFDAGLAVTLLILLPHILVFMLRAADFTVCKSRKKRYGFSVDTAVKARTDYLGTLANSVSDCGLFMGLGQICGMDDIVSQLIFWSAIICGNFLGNSVHKTIKEKFRNVKGEEVTRKHGIPSFVYLVIEATIWVIPMVTSFRRYQETDEMVGQHTYTLHCILVVLCIVQLCRAAFRSAYGYFRYADSKDLPQHKKRYKYMWYVDTLGAAVVVVTFMITIIITGFMTMAEVDPLRTLVTHY